MLTHEQARIFGARDRSRRAAAGSARATGTFTRSAVARATFGTAAGSTGHLTLPDRLPDQLIEGHQHGVITARRADQLFTIHERRFTVTPHWHVSAKIAC